ncbi:hypothetical protein QYE76_017005 [Lolium multiflorum]|uniref:TF-B3 domain-containing protein n=1 Tax=Lolium multiflorum TaxID=4521 RepID=A0AAD8QK76_LOLMU|nr:hypothetical protein QYE76_017005 [Lolium multiflorum]
MSSQSWLWPRQSCTLAVTCDVVVFIVGHAGGGATSVFIVVLKGDPLGIQRLPDKFADFVAGNEPSSLHLREAAYGCCRWIVDVIFDVHGKMYLHIAWEKFVRNHHLEAGFVLTFSYLGEGDMSVKVFDETRCRRHYHGDSDEEDDD